MTSNTGVARSFPAAAAILAERDPVLRRVVTEAGPPHLSPPAESHFAALVRAIVYQQLAGPAAAAIFGRLTTALGGDVTPQRLLSLPDSALRSDGLSGRKAASLPDLAAKVLDGTVTLDPAKLAIQSDDEVIARLSSVRGIGIVGWPGTRSSPRSPVGRLDARPVQRQRGHRGFQPYLRCLRYAWGQD